MELLGVRQYVVSYKKIYWLSQRFDRYRLFVVLLDVLIGVCVWSNISYESTYDVFWETVYQLIDSLDKLVGYLTKNPAGLKLNQPLNSALASFFRYHIFLWYTFVQFLKDPFFWKVLMSTMCVGISIGCTVFADALSLISLHIRCFDLYATRLAGMTISAIGSLWRAFRGKKWNPLRERVDSVVLGSREQFLCTLFFTIILFLLPTIAVYFVVFRVLFIAIWVCHELLERVSHLPDVLEGRLRGVFEEEKSKQD